jgi:hypothetical protein
MTDTVAALLAELATAAPSSITWRPSGEAQ